MIDPDALKAAVDAHERRLDTVWSGRREDAPDAPPGGEQQVEAVAFELPAEEEPGDAGVEVVAFELPEAPPAMPADPDVVSRLVGIEQALAALTEAVTTNRTPAVVPTWLQAAAGDPESYDGPDPARVSVKVRVLPALYSRLEQARARFGLQTLTGTWECLLRLGLAAAERMPVRGT
jgi:hypothetical protein